MKYKANSFYSKIFEPAPGSNPGGVPGKSRWLIMQIDTFNPYDWVAVSRDFRFSQNPYVDATSEASLLASIQEFVNFHEVVYGRNLFVDRNNEPWVTAARADGNPVALTGAYDGVMLTRSLSRGADLAGMELTIVDDVKASGLGPVDPPADLSGFTKEEGLQKTEDPFLKGQEVTAEGKKAGPATPAATPAAADTKKPASPWDFPTPSEVDLNYPPQQKQATFSAGPLILAGAAAAALFYFSRKQGR